MIRLTQIGPAQSGNREDHAEIKQLHARTGRILPQQGQRPEQQHREKCAPPSGDPPAEIIGQSQDGGEQGGIQPVGIGRAITGEVMNQRHQKRIKIGPLIEVVVEG